MSQNPLKNISLRTFRDFLLWEGLKNIQTEGGHEVWSRKDLRRPVILQTHIDPVPEFVVRNALRTIEASKEDYIRFLRSK